MDTNPENAAGPATSPSPNVNNTAGTHPASGHLRDAWLYRRVLRSPIVEPFRKVLRPLVRWVFRPHLHVAAGPDGQGSESVSLKQPSLATVAWWMVFGPLVFVMLLPLLLILVPVVMLLGIAAIIFSAFQEETEDIADRPALKEA